MTRASLLWVLQALLVVPGSALAAPAAPPLTQPSACPFGFYRSGERCLSTPGSTRRAVERVGNACPLGWFSSGRYCVRYR